MQGRGRAGSGLPHLQAADSKGGDCCDPWLVMLDAHYLAQLEVGPEPAQ